MHNKKDIKIGQQLGVFAGYIRRPIPAQTGMLAQIFGENGAESDVVLALSLTKYMDAEVFVSVYLIKSPDGELLKDEKGMYPLATSFMAYVRRSKAMKDGMIAQFFSPNGIHADAVVELSKSDYQDCLVYVDVREATGLLGVKPDPSIFFNESQKEIQENYAHKITKQQLVEEKRKEKDYKKANQELRLSGFLSQEQVVQKLGTGDQFAKWVQDKECCHSQNGICLNEPTAIEINGGYEGYRYLPICETHKDKLVDNKHLSSANNTYYSMKYMLLLKEWSWEIIKEKFSLDGKLEPSPHKIIAWAKENNVSGYLPSIYMEV